jgi:hypothetical protein
MAAVTPLPTLSQIRNWDIEHLGQAADEWEAQAQRWEDTYEQNYRRLAQTDWTGQGREAAVERTGLDLVKVRGVAWQLREAATAARYGFDQQNGAKEWALDAVTDAEQAGFRPKEDLSLTDTHTGGSAADRAARQAQAQALSAQIRHRAALLMASNQEIAAKITAAAGNIGEFSFDEPTGTTATPSTQKRNGVQLVGRGFKQGPDQTGPPNGPSGDDIRRVLDKLPQGSDPRIREVRSQQDLDKLWNWLKQNGVERPGGYGTVPGEMIVLPDGTIVGRREAADSTKQPALDVRVPGDGGYTKVHINPQRGGVPEIPAGPTPAEPQPARPTGPAEGPSAEPRPAEPRVHPEPVPPSAAPPAKPAPVEPPPAPRPAPPRPGFGGFGGGSIGGGGGPLPGIHGNIEEPTL